MRSNPGRGVIFVEDTRTGLGKCQLDIEVGHSAVDSFLYSGQSISLRRDLTEEELDDLQQRFEDAIQEYSYFGGGSRNHN